ncbi:MAG: sulfatase-like hydrolase/transferase [Bacteroidetes bacterium]|nr:sulfatase-like hydrolase/transferase [Bacteroidota bacterium]
MKSKFLIWYAWLTERFSPNALLTAMAVSAISYFFVNEIEWDLGEWVQILFRVLFGAATVLLVLSFAGKITKFVLVLAYTAVFLINRTHYDLFGSRISMGGFYSLFETDQREATEFFNLIPKASVIAVPLFAVAVSILFYRANKEDISSKWAFVVWSILMVIPLGFAMENKADRFDMFHNPLTTISRVYKGVPVIGEGLLTASYYHEKAGFAEVNWTKKPDFITQDSSILATDLVVVVIGESSTRHHYSLYGYGTKTTPFLDRMQAENPNFIALTNAVSPSPLTRESLKRALTFATVEDVAPYKELWNIVDMANEAGYHTVWLSNQAPVGATDTVVGAIAHKSKEHAFISHEVGGDKMDVELGRRFSELVEKRRTGKLFVVLHMIGSHYRYSARSEESDKEAMLALNSATADYDATIYHSDRTLRSILETAESDTRSAAMVYFSDHGEEVAGGAHGFPQLSKVQVDVPFIVWYDMTYADSSRVRRIKDHKDDLYPIEDASYLIADMLGWSVTDRASHLISSDSYIPRVPHIYNVDGEITEYQIELPHSVSGEFAKKNRQK